MDTYNTILTARKLLELPERATMEDIKSNYKTLIRKWHPDKCCENKQQCHEMTKRINAAYKTIIAYCEKYKYSFSQSEVNNYLSEQEWWYQRFGDDPLWGHDTN